MSALGTAQAEKQETSESTKIASEAAAGGVAGAVVGALVGSVAGGPPAAFLGAAIGAGVSAVAVDYVAYEHAEVGVAVAPGEEPVGDAAFKRPTGHDPVSNVHNIEGSPADAHYPTVEYNDLIRKRAFENWNRRGRPEGTAEEDWREAKRQIDLRHGVSDMSNLA